MTRPTLRRCCLAAALVTACLQCPTPVAAQINNAALGAYVGDKLFGDYRPVSLITGKPTPRFVNGQRVLPQEGLLSSPMRRAINRLHHQTAPGTIAAEHTTDFSELTAQNLVLRVPAGGWTQKPPGPNGVVVLHRKDRRLITCLAANRFGVEANPTNESILALSQSYLNNTHNAAIAPACYELSADGVQGVMYRATVQLKEGEQDHRAVWVAAKNGYTYELAVYGDVSMLETIDDTLIDFVRNAREAQPNHVAYGRKEPSKWRFWR